MSELKPVHLLYDERMTLHHIIESKEEYVENKDRIISIHRKLMELEQRLLQRYDKKELFLSLSCPVASKETITLAHSESHYETLEETSHWTDEQLEERTLKAEENEEDVYFSRDTFLAASLACGGVVECVDAVMKKDSELKSSRAIAIVRPPGHHACEDKAMGFGFFNNVAVAAKHAIHTKQASKVVILDWDVHHGNGTQDLTIDDPNISYISLHRAAFGVPNSYFYPMTGRPNEVGMGSAAGTNLNIAFCAARMGNIEYAAAMSELVLPFLSEYQPDLVLISCGLDAAKGDLLGDCELMPCFYHDMTKSILATAGLDIPIVVALEGGYNVAVISLCMEAVAMAILNEDYNEDYDNKYTKEETNLKKEYSNNDDARETRLDQGRQVLNKYWNYHSTDAQKKGNIKKAAIRAINKSMKAIRATPMWCDTLQMNEIVQQSFIPKKHEYRTRTRSKQKSVSSDALTESLQQLSI